MITHNTIGDIWEGNGYDPVHFLPVEKINTFFLPSWKLQGTVYVWAWNFDLSNHDPQI